MHSIQYCVYTPVWFFGYTVGMDTSHKGGLRALFFSIGTFITLLFLVISGIRTGFGIIDRLVFSEQVSWYQLYRSTDMSVSAAFLLVSFIVLLALARQSRGALRQYQETIWHTLCRAILLIILTASVVLTGVSVSLLFGSFFSGDVSLHGFLQTVFTAGVGSAVFYYYRGVLRDVWHTQEKQERLFVTAVGVFVGLLVVGAVVTFNPFKQPALEETYDTLVCLQSVSHALEGRYIDEKNSGLPSNEGYQAFLERDLPSYHYKQDPACQDMAITYELIDSTHYRLCAPFAMLPEGTDVQYYPYHEFPVTEVGESCFERGVGG